MLTPPCLQRKRQLCTMTLEQQQQQQHHEELVGQSMLRMIRSARHRLQREASFGSEAAARPLPVGHPRPSRSRSHVDQLLLSRGSENAGPTPGALPLSTRRSERRSEKQPILGDVTNVTNLAGQQRPVLQCRPHLGDSSCTKPLTSDPPREPAPAASVPPPLPPHRDVDVDKAHAEDPQHVAEYAADIYWNLQQHEGQQLSDPNYMERQPQVTCRMRAILVDWLVDVHKKYKLRPQTLFLAIGILDRFLERRSTHRRHLQLAGVTALLVAAKFEELYPPQINDFVYVTDKAYSREDIMRMEVSILTVLEFQVCAPTAVHFLERYQAINSCGDAHRELAQYLLELTLVDVRMLKYTPSHLAAAAVLLSNKLLRRQPAWTPSAVKHTKMTEQMLRECGKEICALLEAAEANPLQAVRKKYSQAKHHAVAKMGFAGLPPSLPPPPPPPSAAVPAVAAPGRAPQSSEVVPAVAIPSRAPQCREAPGSARASQDGGVAQAQRGTSVGSSVALEAAPAAVEASSAWSPMETVSV
uniref:Cyclin N-terminal domain-containing protein n=1 Tax=Alexandrium monilatum TaxID=311494 RepID=A0A7S4SK67_9DINO